MLLKTLIFGYVSTVDTNRNQIDFRNLVLSVALNKFSGIPRINQTSPMANKNTRS